MLSEKNSNARTSALNEVLSFTYPQLYTGACWYIGFYAFDPVRKAMRRKRIKINTIGTAAQKRRYASRVCHRLAEKLEAGWNPWVDAEADRNYKQFGEVLVHYRNHINKQLVDGVLRQSTIHGYMCSARIMEKWNEGQPTPIQYIYQFDRAFCVRFLDYVYLERGNTPSTRNNALAFLRSFSTFLVQHLYLKDKPTEGLQRISKGLTPKTRTVIDGPDMQRLHDWLEKNNRPFLLVCYFLHYMLIRPKEIARLRLRDVSVARQTVFISETISKNKKAGTVTIPQKIIELMVDLGYFNYPDSYYIFSKDFRPGPFPGSERHYRQFWTTRIVPALKFPASYQLYSLKDTGITAMLRAGCDPLSVKEQARHSSLSMTDIYTPHDIRTANPALSKYDGIL